MKEGLWIRTKKLIVVLMFSMKRVGFPSIKLRKVLIHYKCKKRLHVQSSQISLTATGYKVKEDPRVRDPAPVACS